MKGQADAIYEAVDRFLAGLVAGGVADVIVSPGMRGTLLTLSANRRPDLRIGVVLDERSAGFVALGLAKSTGKPVGLICTSGTAGANYYPAIIEASLTRVPLVVITADRPPEAHGWDAAQTVDQVGLFGDHVREAIALPVGEFDLAIAEHFGLRASTTAGSNPAGPVHVNWPFREPVGPPPGWSGKEPFVSTARASVAVSGVRDEWVDELVDLARFEKGLIVAGPRLGSGERMGVAAFAAATGWPVAADPLSQLRSDDMPGVLATTAHLFARGVLPDSMTPEVVVRIGDSPTAKSFRLWAESVPIEHFVLIDPDQRWADPSGKLTTRLPAPPGALLAAAAVRIEARSGQSWLDQWRQVDQLATEAIDSELAGGPFCEPAATRAVLGTMGRDDPLHLASSMPVRDVDMFMPVTEFSPVLSCNRGANGIDGTISTAVGIALGSDRRTTVLVGDLAFIHDLGGLVTAARLEVDLSIVVLDNGGGGIFSLLPIADQADSFEELYTTPHKVDFASAGAMVGCRHAVASSADEVSAVLSEARRAGGVTIVEVPIDMGANVAQIHRIGERVAACLGVLGGS